MANSRGSYPHPVLDQSDDVGATFEVFNVSITPTVQDVEISFQVRMTDPDIQALLDSGQARYNFRWLCSSTIDGGALDHGHGTAMADSTRYVSSIDQTRIRRTVRVSATIIADREIPDYRLHAQHPDYGDAHFHVRPGDVIGDAGFVEFEPYKLFDPLEPPVGSCFRFVADATLRKALEVRFHDDEYVVVAFPEQRLAEFGGLAARPDLQISLVVLPALMETIAFIRRNDEAGEDGEDLSDRQWVSAIRSLVVRAGSLEDPPFRLAQRILANPLDLTLSLSLDRADEED